MLNIHPSLLPAFKGLNVHERMINAGVKIAGDWLKYDKGNAAKYDAAMRANGVFKSAGKTYPSLALTEADLTLVEEAIAAAAKAVVA